jgi:hypothetical protein
MSRGKTARKKAAERAKFKRRRLYATNAYKPMVRRKQKIRLKSGHKR